MKPKAEQLRRAAREGDASRARELVLAGAPVWAFEEEPASAFELAQSAGHDATAGAILDAIAERSRAESAARATAVAARCEAPDAFAARLAGGNGPVLFADSLSSAAPDAGRQVFAFRIAGPRLVRLGRAWIAVADYERPLPLVRGSRAAACDNLGGIGWPRFVWSDDGTRLSLWRKRRLVLEATAAEVVVRRVLRSIRFATSDLTAISVDVDDGWTRHRLTVRARSPRPVTIAARFDPIALLDPTYDGIDLDFDTWWADAVAEAIHARTGVPVRRPDRERTSGGGRRADPSARGT